MDTLAKIILIIGVLVVLVGALGLLRFPDFFSRLNSAGISDVFGAQLILFALALLSDSWVVSAKLILIMLLIFFLSPVVSHALAKMAHEQEKKITDGTDN